MFGTQAQPPHRRCKRCSGMTGSRDLFDCPESVGRSRRADFGTAGGCLAESGSSRPKLAVYVSRPQRPLPAEAANGALGT